MRRRVIAGLAVSGLVVGLSTVLVAPPADASGPTGPAVTATQASSPLDLDGFTSISPVRLLDTRTSTGPIPPSGTMTVQLTGQPGIPSTGVAAVVVNVTVASAQAAGFLTVYAAGTPRPSTSNVNFTAGQTVANQVVAAVGPGGAITIDNRSSGDTQVIVDVSGWFATGGYYNPLAPARVLDTRFGLGSPDAPVGPATTVDVQVTGRGGVPDTAVAVAANLTGTQPTATTFVTAYPSDASRPATSNLNLVAGQTAAVSVISGLSALGTLALYNASGSTQLVLDVVGWFSANERFHPITPVRAYDSRDGDGPLQPGENRVADLSTTAHTVDDPGALVVSVTAAAPATAGYLSVEPLGGPSGTSTVNYQAGRSVANLAIVRADAVPRTLIHSSGATDVVVDVVGWFSYPITFEQFPQEGVDPIAVVGAPFTVRLFATGGTAPYTWSVIGGLDGLSLTPTGDTTADIDLTATSATSVTLVVEAADATGLVGRHAIPLTVNKFRPGALWSWGAPAGQGRTTFSLIPGRVGAEPDVLSGVTAFGGGFDTGYAVQSDGTLWAWGLNDAGQLGDGTTTEFQRVTPVRVQGLSGAVSVDGGGKSAFAVRSDGTVWAWGDNRFGQLGDGTSVTRLTPVQVPGLTGATAVSSSGGTTYVLRDDGTVWAWGANNAGQVGDGTTTNRLTPVQVSGLSDVTAIASGDSTGYALRSDGTVWAWGANIAGQIGDGTTTDHPTPVRIPSLSGVTAIASNRTVAYALRSDGTVWSWGNGNTGQLGDGTTAFQRLTPVQVAGLSNATSIAAGFTTGFASTSDGTVVGWGDPTALELGPDHFDPVLAPIPIGYLPPVTALAAGDQNVYALGPS